MDFGIARAAAERRLTQTGRTLGSLYYMSPEQINGVNLDARSDLYSLGVALYEIVTGRRPFQGDSDYSIMAAHLQSMPVPPVQLDPNVPAPLNDIILTAIAKDPAHRFQSADALSAALENVRGQLWGGYQPAPPQRPPRRLGAGFEQTAALYDRRVAGDHRGAGCRGDSDSEMARGACGRKHPDAGRNAGAASAAAAAASSRGSHPCPGPAGGDSGRAAAGGSRTTADSRAGASSRDGASAAAATTTATAPAPAGRRAAGPTAAGRAAR
jgi:hypothetical protein